MALVVLKSSAFCSYHICACFACYFKYLRERFMLNFQVCVCFKDMVSINCLLSSKSTQFMVESF